MAIIQRDENGRIPPWPKKVMPEIHPFIVNGAVQDRIILPLWCPHLPRYKGVRPPEMMGDPPPKRRRRLPIKKVA
jgi:hypothetical protein